MNCLLIKLNWYLSKNIPVKNNFLHCQDENGLQLNAVGGWWLLMQLKEKVVSGKVQTPSQPNSRTLSLSRFFFK